MHMFLQDGCDDPLGSDLPSPCPLQQPPPPLLLLQAVDDSVHCSVVVVSHTGATNTLNLDASTGPPITLPILPEFPAGVREEDSMCVTFASDASHI